MPVSSDLILFARARSDSPLKPYPFRVALTPSDNDFSFVFDSSIFLIRASISPLILRTSTSNRTPSSEDASTELPETPDRRSIDTAITHANVTTEPIVFPANIAPAATTSNATIDCFWYLPKKPVGEATGFVSPAPPVLGLALYSSSF